MGEYIVQENEQNKLSNMKFSIKDFCSNCDQIRRNMRIWSHLLKKSLIKSFIFCAFYVKSVLETSSSVYFVDIFHTDVFFYFNT